MSRKYIPYYTRIFWTFLNIRFLSFDVVVCPSFPHESASYGQDGKVSWDEMFGGGVIQWWPVIHNLTVFRVMGGEVQVDPYRIFMEWVYPNHLSCPNEFYNSMMFFFLNHWNFLDFYGTILGHNWATNPGHLTRSGQFLALVFWWFFACVDRRSFWDLDICSSPLRWLIHVFFVK